MRRVGTNSHISSYAHTHTPAHPHIYTCKLTCTNGRSILSVVTIGVAPVAMVTLKNNVFSPIALHVVQPDLCWATKVKRWKEERGREGGRKERAKGRNVPFFPSLIEV